MKVELARFLFWLSWVGQVHQIQVATFQDILYIPILEDSENIEMLEIESQCGELVRTNI